MRAEYISKKFSDDISWGELKELVNSHPDVNDHTKIDSFRLKASHNRVYLTVNDDLEIVLGD